MDLKNKNIIVTGASKGIGFGIAKKLLQEGANVVLNYHSDEQGARSIEKEFGSKSNKIAFFKANISKQSEAAALVDFAVKTLGKIDGVVNNAGVYEPSPLEGISEAHIEKHFAVNVKGLLFVIQAAARAFGKHGGSIVNVSSSVTVAPPTNFVAYVASKGAVDAITKTLAQELASRNIRVNTVAPGVTKTEGISGAGLPAEVLKHFESRTPLGSRLGEPQDIAGVAAFLLSDDSAWITGQYIAADGGFRF